MPMNGQTVGRDVSLDLMTSRGLLAVPAQAITDFSSQPTPSATPSKGRDGIPRHAVLPDGWSGVLSIDRMGSQVDDYWAQLEADFYAGVNIQSGTITETIQEPNGGVSQYRYTGVMFDYKDAGTKTPNQLVKLKLNFMAARRFKVS